MGQVQYMCHIKYKTANASKLVSDKNKYKTIPLGSDLKHSKQDSATLFPLAAWTNHTNVCKYFLCRACV